MMRRKSIFAGFVLAGLMAAGSAHALSSVTLNINVVVGVVPTPPSATLTLTELVGGGMSFEFTHGGPSGNDDRIEILEWNYVGALGLTPVSLGSSTGSFDAPTFASGASVGVNPSGYDFVFRASFATSGGESDTFTLGDVARWTITPTSGTLMLADFVAPGGVTSTVPGNVAAHAWLQGGNTNIAAIAPIPEPGTYAMLIAGLGLLGFMARRRLRG